MDSNQLSMCLTELLQPDTSRVKAAEATLKPYLKDPRCLGGLLEQIQANPNPGVRQIAAVVLRKRIPSYWSKLDPNSQATVQQALLSILQAEAERPVRKAVVTVTCAVAKPCFARPDTHWTMLLEFVNACCAAPHDEAREMGFMLLEYLSETIGRHLEEIAPSLVPLLGAGLADSNPSVQAAALRAGGMLMGSLASSELVLPFQDLVPSMLGVLRQRCESGDEDVVSQVLDALEELAQAPIPVLNKHVPALVGFLLEIIKADGLEAAIRDQVLATAVHKSKPCVISGNPRRRGKNEHPDSECHE